MALLHLILWLIHAVTRALASAIVDVFSSLAGILLSIVVVGAVFAAVASAFGIGGLGVVRRRRRSRAE